MSQGRAGSVCRRLDRRVYDVLLFEPPLGD